MTSKNYTSAYMVFSARLGYLLSNASKFKSDAIALKPEFGSCTPSFHLLSSIVVELFPKILIGYDVCLKYANDRKVTEEDIINEIDVEFRKHGHRLDSLFNSNSSLMKSLGIESVYRITNDVVWEYRFKKIGTTSEIAIKDIEGARYGSFAKNSDIATFCVFDEMIIDLLNGLEDYVTLYRKETFDQLMKGLKS